MMNPVSDADFDVEVVGADLPVVVDFWAEWCAPCKVLSPILSDLSEELDGRIKIVSLDAASNPNVMTKYNVRNMPTMLLFKNGEPADMRVGLQSKVSLLKWMEEHTA